MRKETRIEINMIDIRAGFRIKAGSSLPLHFKFSERPSLITGMSYLHGLQTRFLKGQATARISVFDNTTKPLDINNIMGASIQRIGSPLLPNRKLSGNGKKDKKNIAAANFGNILFAYVFKACSTVGIGTMYIVLQ